MRTSASTSSAAAVIVADTPVKPKKQTKTPKTTKLAKKPKTTPTSPKSPRKTRSKTIAHIDKPIEQQEDLNIKDGIKKFLLHF